MVLAISELGIVPCLILYLGTMAWESLLSIMQGVHAFTWGDESGKL